MSIPLHIPHIIRKLNNSLPPEKRLIILKYYKRVNSNRKFSILAEWTRFCNLSCPICDIGSPRMRPAGHISLDLWKKILYDCKKYNMFVDWTHSIGEPLLWENLEKGIKMWKDSGLSKYGHISTNGILLDEGKAEIIKNSGIEFIRICLDTLDENLYRELRANEYHQRIIQNIRNFIKIAPNIRTQVTLMKTAKNFDESPETIKKLFDNKIEVFQTTLLKTSHSKNIQDLVSGKAERQKSNICPKVFYEHCVISWDGYVTLCCFDTLLLNKVGKLSERTNLKDMYLSKAADKIRKEILRGDFSHAPACKECSMDFMNDFV